jgi:hypothetical protein
MRHLFLNNTIELIPLMFTKVRSCARQMKSRKLLQNRHHVGGFGHGGVLKTGMLQNTDTVRVLLVGGLFKRSHCLDCLTGGRIFPLQCPSFLTLPQGATTNVPIEVLIENHNVTVGT